MLGEPVGGAVVTQLGVVMVNQQPSTIIRGNLELLGDDPTVLSREQMLSHVWGYDYDPGSNIVDVYVRALRRKIGTEQITTGRGMGYRCG